MYIRLGCLGFRDKELGLRFKVKIIVKARVKIRVRISVVRH